MNKKGFVFTLTAGIVLAFALVLAILFGGAALIVFLTVKNAFILIGALIIVFSVIKGFNVTGVLIGIGLLFTPFLLGLVGVGDFTGLQIVPSEPGISILTSEGKGHFEVGDKFGNVVGAIPTPRGSGGRIVAYQIFFDGNMVGCLDERFGGYQKWCVCSEDDYRPSGTHYNYLVGCNGYTSGNDCISVCNNEPLETFEYVVKKDVRVQGSVFTIETTRDGQGNSYESPLASSFDFIMPVYEPETIEKFTLINCQTENSEETGYCSGVCEENELCNIETVIRDPVPIEQQEFTSWKPIKGKCWLVTEFGNNYFELQEECEQNIIDLKENLTLYERFIEWLRILF